MDGCGVMRLSGVLRTPPDGPAWPTVPAARVGNNSPTTSPADATEVLIATVRRAVSQASYDVCVRSIWCDVDVSFYGGMFDVKTAQEAEMHATDVFHMLSLVPPRTWTPVRVGLKGKAPSRVNYGPPLFTELLSHVISTLGVAACTQTRSSYPPADFKGLDVPGATPPSSRFPLPMYLPPITEVAAVLGRIATRRKASSASGTSLVAPSVSPPVLPTPRRSPRRRNAASVVAAVSAIAQDVDLIQESDDGGDGDAAGEVPPDDGGAGNDSDDSGGGPPPIVLEDTLPIEGNRGAASPAGAGSDQEDGQEKRPTDGLVAGGQGQDINEDVEADAGVGGLGTYPPEDGPAAVAEVTADRDGPGRGCPPPAGSNATRRVQLKSGWEIDVTWAIKPEYAAPGVFEAKLTTSTPCLRAHCTTEAGMRGIHATGLRVDVERVGALHGLPASYWSTCMSVPTCWDDLWASAVAAMARHGTCNTVVKVAILEDVACLACDSMRVSGGMYSFKTARVTQGGGRSSPEKGHSQAAALQYLLELRAGVVCRWITCASRPATVYSVASPVALGNGVFAAQYGTLFPVEDAWRVTGLDVDPDCGVTVALPVVAELTVERL